MEQISAEERELRSAMVRYIEGADRTCGTQLLSEEEVLERDRRSIRTARNITKLVMELVRCRQTSEDFKEEALRELAYRFSGSISWEELKYSMDSPPQRQ